MMKFFSLLIVFWLFYPLAQSQNAFQIAKDELDIRGEIYFRFQNSSAIDADMITRMISIDHATTQEWIYAYANDKEFKNYLALGYPFEILPHPGSLIIPEMKSSIDPKSVLNWDFYPTYEAYVDQMYQFEALYPGLCDVFSIGETTEGRALLMAKIRADVNIGKPVPRFLYTSTIHGDETTGYVLMLRLIEYLLQNYGSDARITALLDNVEIWINPLANPDGTYAAGNSSVYGATRFNANNIDLNRNYPDPDDGQHPDGNAWQPETMAFMDLADSVMFTMSANFHGGAEVFNYPWDTWQHLHADDNWWQFVGREWADTVHANAPSGYFDDLNNGITNGYAWYTITGGRQDFMNYFHHCREVTVEISNIKILPESQLPAFWEYNYRSFLNYMHQCGYGLTGTVTDSATGQALAATIHIEGHDMDNSWITTYPGGNYSRVLLEGNYPVKFSATGHKSKTIESVGILNYQSTVLDAALPEGEDAIGEFEYNDVFSLTIDPNNSLIRISYQKNEPLDARIEIFDLDGRIIRALNHSFQSAGSVISLPVNELRSGLYLLRLGSGNFSAVEKVIVK